jgi:hypothetical protein
MRLSLTLGREVTIELGADETGMARAKLTDALNLAKNASPLQLRNLNSSTYKILFTLPYAH